MLHIKNSHINSLQIYELINYFHEYQGKNLGIFKNKNFIMLIIKASLTHRQSKTWGTVP